MIASVLVVCSTSFTGLVGCASGPSVSGFGLLARHVSVGDIVELSSPYDPETGLEWRLASYDSALLEIQSPPRVVQRSNGEYELIANFRARNPGSTEVVFQRRLAAEQRDGPGTRKFTVNIRE